MIDQTMMQHIPHIPHFRTYWKHKGHEFGQCQTLPDSPWFWIKIPKNASTYTQTLFAHQLLWSHYNYFDIDVRNKIAIIVIRDPVERWISGIAEYVTLYHKNFHADDVNRQMLDWIFDRVAFDDHTESQICFIRDVNLQQAVWFKCDVDFENKLVLWMESVGLTSPGFLVPNCVREFGNKTLSDSNKKHTREFFNRVVMENPSYLAAVKRYFKPDYDLINRVNFQ